MIGEDVVAAAEQQAVIGADRRCIGYVAPMRGRPGFVILDKNYAVVGAASNLSVAKRVLQDRDYNDRQARRQK